MSGEAPPPAEEPGGEGETRSRFAHKNRFEVDDGEDESDEEDSDVDDEDQAADHDAEADTLANDLSKLSKIGSKADPWSSTDPWRSGRIEGNNMKDKLMNNSSIDKKVTTHVSGPQRSSKISWPRSRRTRFLRLWQQHRLRGTYHGFRRR